jgi:lipopolysaccharide export system protein LptA
MPLYLTILVHLLLVTQASSAGTDEAHADRSVTLRSADGLMRLYIGAVEMSFDEVRVGADSARVRDDDDRVLFVGGVRLTDTERSVAADTLRYSRRTGLASFHGSVLLAEGPRRISAESVVYDRSAGLLRAHGVVRFRNAEAGVRMNADALVYHPGGDSGRAVGNTTTVKSTRMGADTIQVRADTLHFAGSGEHLAFRGRVGIRQHGFRTESDEAEYGSTASVLRLAGNVRSLWPGEAGGDSIRASADRMSILSKADEEQDVSMAGSVSLNLGGRPEADVTARVASGDSAWARVVQRRLAQVLIFGSATVQFRTGQDGLASLSADTASIHLVEGMVDSLSLAGGATALQVSAGDSVENRVAGDRLAVLVRADRIRHLEAVGRASCEHTARGEEGETIKLTGDKVSISFGGGKLRHAGAEGGVRGSYLPEKAEAP